MAAKLCQTYDYVANFHLKFSFYSIIKIIAAKFYLRFFREL